MSIKIICPNCNSSFDVSEEYIWKKWKCVKCWNIIDIKESDITPINNLTETILQNNNSTNINNIPKINNPNNKENNYLKVFSWIIIPVIIVIFYAFNYYSTYKINKFIKLFNEQNTITQDVLRNFSLESLNKSSQILNWTNNVSFNLPDSDYNKIKSSTENLTNNWCPLLKYTKNECIAINNILLDVIWKMHNSEFDWLKEKTKEFTEKYSEYKDLLEKKEWIKFKSY